MLALSVIVQPIPSVAVVIKLVVFTGVTFIEDVLSPEFHDIDKGAVPV
jgi:hypothetical protein